MKEWLKKIELFVDKFIPYLLVLLIFVIIIELFFHDVAEAYRYHINLLDGFIVLVFLLDLYFKYQQTKNIPTFVRKYWVEILAIFPFYLFFRFIETTLGLLEMSGLIKQGQNILHSGIEIEKEIAVIGREVVEAEKLEKIGVRSRALARTFRIVSRTPRLVAAAQFYEEPKLLKKFDQKTRTKLKKASTNTRLELKEVLKDTRKKFAKIQRKILRKK
ncbi:hypothetical protein J4449_02700 [Candidatus Woesearchaeota archaeon]|nr:hypothetical protein [Candidatus Woesearchaeota archaeon]